MKTDRKEERRKRGYEMLRRTVLVQRNDITLFVIASIFGAVTLVFYVVPPPQAEAEIFGPWEFRILATVATVMCLVLSIVSFTTGVLMQEIEDLKDGVSALKENGGGSGGP